jgi:probable blue pigment (indigoidine) exporter
MTVKTRGGWVASTVAAPIAWGTTYVTVTELFPPDRPLFVATARVLPAGLALLAVAAVVSHRRADGGRCLADGGTRPRWHPRGAEWRRAAILALFNFGLFFPLLSVAVYRLPGGVAAAVGGLQPLLVAVVLRPDAQIDPVGVLAAVAANASFALGVVLSKQFPVPASRIGWTGWQLVISGVMLVPLTGVVEGVPASLSGRTLAGIAYLSLIGTAVAFLLWFNGIRRLPVAAPPLLGLAAPVTGAALGWVALGQALSPLQLAGFVITLSAIAYGAILPGPLRRPAPVVGTRRVTRNADPAFLSVGCVKVSACRTGRLPASRSPTRSTMPAGGSCSARSAPA